MRNHVCIHAAEFRLPKPRGLVRDHFQVHDTAQVSADPVHRERRRIRRLLLDVRIRQEAELNQRLEAVADAEYQAVALV